MESKKHTVTTLMISCSILVLAAALLLFPEDVQARGRRHPNFQEQVRKLRSENAGTAVLVGTKEAPPAQAVATAASPPAAGTVVQPAAVSESAVVSSRATFRRAAFGDIEVSFKLDPRQTDSLYKYMGESWVSPPISIHAGAQTGTASTVQARVRVLDAKGQPVDISPEWVPGDSEMVTVSPSKGNEVMITVRQAGQSSLQLVSENVSKEISIMAWRQGNALQVQISEKQ